MTSAGSLDVVTGGMFSGKSEELIRQLKRAVIAKKSIMVFKPVIDNRYSHEMVVSHSRQEIPACPWNQNDPLGILYNNSEWHQAQKDYNPFVTVEWSWNADVIGIDEAQFFGSDIITVVDTLVDMGKRVIVAGLDLDFRGEPFGSMPILMAKADHITHLTAICTVCGQPAIRTQRLDASSDESVVIGGDDKYAARCRQHFTPGPKST